VAGDRLIGIARELTKVHEELVIRQISQLVEYFTDPRGEFTVLLPPPNPAAGTSEEITAEALAAEFGELTKIEAGSKRGAVKVIARRHGLTANEVYRLLQQRDRE
jgi:16S rRNA (cytidine1402-2'-O)-methyltransferase